METAAALLKAGADPTPLVGGMASILSNGGWFNRWGDSAAGLGHIFAAAGVRVRAAFGDG
eukprot:scaffold40666_cov40-Phaeocystis_antarctica.AAC.2